MYVQAVTASSVKEGTWILLDNCVCTIIYINTIKGTPDFASKILIIGTDNQTKQTRKITINPTDLVIVLEPKEVKINVE